MVRDLVQVKQGVERHLASRTSAGPEPLHHPMARGPDFPACRLEPFEQLPVLENDDG
jgi:hypothetical protein